MGMTFPLITFGSTQPPNLRINRSGCSTTMSLGASLSSHFSRVTAATITRCSKSSSDVIRPALIRPILASMRLRDGSRRDSTGSARQTASGPATRRVLYDGHLPTSPLQRTAMAGWAAVSALMAPERADMVATLGEVTGRSALERLYRIMLTDPEGREVLRARPVINGATVDLAALAALPNGTFGKAYSDFMEGNKFSPDSRSAVQFVDDPDLAYVMRRYREVHDLWHVLSGLPPTVEGELALKWFELIQTGLPVCALGAVFGPFALPSAESRGNGNDGSTGYGAPKEGGQKRSGGGGRGGSREVLASTYIPWAVRAGRNTRKPLMCVWYERRWEQSLEAVRRELAFEVAPRRDV